MPSGLLEDQTASEILFPRDTWEPGTKQQAEPPGRRRFGLHTRGTGCPVPM